MSTIDEELTYLEETKQQIKPKRSGAGTTQQLPD